MYYITEGNFAVLLDGLKTEYDVYVPVKKDKQRFYKKYTEFSADIVIGEVRAFEPLKSFFSLARGIVARGFSPEIPKLCEKPLCIVGVKACDLKGFKIQDHVFNDHDCPDSAYRSLRQNNLIISSDCTLCIDTCFCLSIGLKPYPQEEFDINLSQVSGGFIVESGSNKGKDLIAKNSSLFENPKSHSITGKNEARAKVTKDVERNIQDSGVPYQESFENIIERNYESKIWEEEANTCVECGACNTICPTCHCFLLYDQKNEKNMARLRIWDSCMIKDFARVAGGANPRAKLWMRLRNRFDKKFDFFPKVAKTYACTGCGRCISACPAKIDIRKVLKRLVGDAKR
ncbi:MAG: 4Fe-4S dicluster domain-containing protein [Omnitrophica bacterium]|nr:4Fe-4S dicluster domain-containing protein [Candidatus Omnitrophota bacterium]